MITEVEPYIFISNKIDQKHIDELIYLIKECDGAEYYLKDGPYKKKLVKGLMSARRDVGTALKKKDKKMERNARKRVHEFKKKLGER